MIGRINAMLERVLESEVDGRAMALTRIVVGYAAWFEAGQNVSRIGQYTPGQLHLDYGLELNWSAEQLQLICEWQLRFALALIAGVFSRVFALATLTCQASLFFVSQLNFRNHIYMVMILLLLLSFARADARWSLQAVFRKLIGRPLSSRNCPALPARLIQAQVLIVYFYSGLHKLLLGFGNGYPLCRFLGRELPRGRSGDDLSAEHLEWVVEHMSRDGCTEAIPAFILLGSIGTIIVELALAAAFGFRRTVWLAVVCGLGLHLSIWWAMDVVTFGLMMVATYPLFVVSPPLTVATKKSG